MLWRIENTQTSPRLGTEQAVISWSKIFVCPPADRVLKKHACKQNHSRTSTHGNLFRGSETKLAPCLEVASRSVTYPAQGLCYCDYFTTLKNLEISQKSLILNFTYKSSRTKQLVFLQGSSWG